MKTIVCLFRAFMISVLILFAAVNARAFNLWHDLQQNTQWTLGSNAAAGTAVALKDNDTLGVKGGQYVASFLAQIAQYRFLSAWWGGNEIKQPDGTQKLFDTAKLGFNVAYLFTGFVNQPPDLIKRLVVGPSVTMSLFTTPHVIVPFFDVNYQFGAVATNTQPVATVAPPSVPPTSRLNLLYEPTAG